MGILCGIVRSLEELRVRLHVIRVSLWRKTFIYFRDDAKLLAGCSTKQGAIQVIQNVNPFVPELIVILQQGFKLSVALELIPAASRDRTTSWKSSAEAVCLRTRSKHYWGVP